MNRSLQVWVEGVGCWAPGLADWPAWRILLRDGGAIDTAARSKPSPARLAAAERRRVSTHVLDAIEVADQAVAMSGRNGAALPCIFASAYGDTGIMDYMCATLADAPRNISPTRFHNSVHNAAAGYWTIASHSHAASQAVAAGAFTFAAGLLEAAVQAQAENRLVLLVAHDEPASGPLAEVFAVEQPFACALVLSPQAGDAAVARLALTLADTAPRTDTPRHPDAARLAGSNPAARGLVLLEALASTQPRHVTLAAADGLELAVGVQPGWTATT